MSRIALYFLFIGLLFCNPSKGFGQFSFEIILEEEGESDLFVTGLIEASDGSFIGKYSNIKYNDTLNIWNEYLIRVSPFGDTSTYLFHKEDTVFYITRVFQVNENPMRFFVSGIFYPGDQYEWCQELFMLLDENFEIIWEKKYNLSSVATVFPSSDIMQLTDGSFLYARHPAISSYVYFFHLSADGDSLAFREYEGDSAGQVMALTYSPDSTSIWWHAHLAHYDPSGPESQVVVLNDDLEQTRVMYYPRWFSQNYYAKVLPDNKLVVGGRYFDFDNSYLSTYILDTGLNVLHESYLTNPDTNIAAMGRCVDYYYPNQIFVGGTHNSGSSWGSQPTWIILAKYNEELELVYERYLGGDANYWLHTVTATSDSGVILSGTRYDYEEPVTRKKAFIIKLNPEGLLVGNGGVVPETILVKAITYPNPGNNILNLRTAKLNTTFNLYDIKGKVVLTKEINQVNNTFTVDHLSAGIYSWTLYDDTEVYETGKWIKQ